MSSEQLFVSKFMKGVTKTSKLTLFVSFSLTYYIYARNIISQFIKKLCKRYFYFYVFFSPKNNMVYHGRNRTVFDTSKKNIKTIKGILMGEESQIKMILFLTFFSSSEVKKQQ